MLTAAEEMIWDLLVADAAHLLRAWLELVAAILLAGPLALIGGILGRIGALPLSPLGTSIW